MKTRFVPWTFLCVVSWLAWTAACWSADKPAVVGKWKWSIERGGQTIETTLTIKQEGDKLTGTVTGRNNTETPVQDLKFEKGELSFKVTREWNGQKMVLSYKGKLEGDTIKGTVERDRDGEKTTRDWEAKRVKE
ncbi:hypothetical protein [Limisphaera sp. VF-2]|jgi:hypothetical protein|uniref:hypothetical protein n=1 Tax=Limisphaera sp. VF-2 TaxID=3400418 RepID=UPI0017651B59|nr:hypothetical protein [Limisphaera sp.]